MKLDFPLDLSIESVDYCNYTCPYCPRAENQGSKDRISKDAFMSVIDEFSEKTGGLGAVGFDRGEPLIDRHLEDKVRYIDDRGIADIIVTTNGVFLTADRSRRLIEAGLTKLHISLDAATQETYTKTRGGNLALVEKNVHDFLRIREERRARIPIVRVSFVVCELNEHEIPLFEAKWAHLVEYVEFQDCVDFSRVDALEDYPVEPFWCHYPFQQVVVTAGGELRPCCSFYNKHLIFGRLENGDTIERVFNCSQNEQLRQSFLQKKDYALVCKNCRCAPPAGSGIRANSLLKPAARPAKGAASPPIEGLFQS